MMESGTTAMEAITALLVALVLCSNCYVSCNFLVIGWTDVRACGICSSTQSELATSSAVGVVHNAALRPVMVRSMSFDILP